MNFGVRWVWVPINPFPLQIKLRGGAFATDSGALGCAHCPRAAPRRDDWEGRGPFEVDSFHATPIGIMLNAEKIAGDRSPFPPPVPPPMVVPR